MVPSRGNNIPISNIVIVFWILTDLQIYKKKTTCLTKLKKIYSPAHTFSGRGTLYKQINDTHNMNLLSEKHLLALLPLAALLLLDSCEPSEPGPQYISLGNSQWYSHEQKETNYGGGYKTISYIDCDLFFTSDNSGYFFFDMFRETTGSSYSINDTATVFFNYTITPDGNGKLSNLKVPSRGSIMREMPLTYSDSTQTIQLTLTDNNLTSTGIRSLTFAPVSE